MKQSDSENIPPKARSSAEREDIPAIEDIPTVEEVEEELGFDAMDFFSSMVCPEPREGEGRLEMWRRRRQENESASQKE